jgi:hypothetical protein
LRFAVAVGPVLLLYFYEIDEDVLAPQAEAIMQSIRDGLVEGTLKIDRSPYSSR